MKRQGQYAKFFSWLNRLGHERFPSEPQLQQGGFVAVGDATHGIAQHSDGQVRQLVPAQGATSVANLRVQSRELVDGCRMVAPPRPLDANLYDNTVFFEAR